MMKERYMKLVKMPENLMPEEIVEQSFICGDTVVLTYRVDRAMKGEEILSEMINMLEVNP